MNWMEELQKDLVYDEGELEWYDRSHRFPSIQHPYSKKIYCFRNSKKVNNSKPKSLSHWRKTLTDKICNFREIKGTKLKSSNFTVEDVINKFGEKPKCYLTGQQLDIHDSSSYHFDHIIPRTKGGNNTLSNLGLCSKDANFAKSDKTPEEFIELCRQVLMHNGYMVTK
jgi:CRISPR/Cas system Type II protein with McrA/HNH and RuvC-like nuclease domain